MHKFSSTKPLRYLSSALVVCACLLGASAQAAGLLGDSIEARLYSPNGILSDPSPIDLQDTVTVAAGAEITAGDGSNIGSFMLTGGLQVQEAIDFGAFSISLRLLKGDDGPPPTTGYAHDAKYIFSDLDIAGSTITGASITSSTGITNLDQSWLSFDSPHQLSFAIDQIQFKVPASGATYGDVVITLQTQPDTNLPSLPEPGSFALAGVALLAAWGTRRRATRGS